MHAGILDRFIHAARGRADTEAMASVWSELREELAIMRRKDPRERVRVCLGEGFVHMLPAGLYRFLLELAAGVLGHVLSAAETYRAAAARPQRRILEVLESGALARMLTCLVWRGVAARLARGACSAGAGAVSVPQAIADLVFRHMLLQSYLNCRERRESPPRRLGDLRASLASWEALAQTDASGLEDLEAEQDMLMEACREVLPWTEPCRIGSKEEWEQALQALERCRSRAVAFCLGLLASVAEVGSDEAARLAGALPRRGLGRLATQEALPVWNERFEHFEDGDWD